jgi:8-oxo-dGTP pyrophosphatase MutT (NUDIX family)
MITTAALQLRILSALPGFAAQQKMMPPSRKEYKGIVPANARIGAVMVVLYEEQNEWNILLMRRTEDGGTHSGQISMPGGKRDAQDGSNTYTSIRELEEEIGIRKEDIDVLGSMTPLYIPPSNFYVTPIVAIWKNKNKISVSEAEVQEVLQLPLQKIFSSVISTNVNRSDIPEIAMETPAYAPKEGILIWGATAMMLAELEALLHQEN